MIRQILLIFLMRSMNSLGKTPDVFAMNQRIGRGLQ